MELDGADGSEVWTRDLAPDPSVQEVAIDDRGVAVLVREGTGRTVATWVLGWHIDGSPRADWPVNPARVESGRSGGSSSSRPCVARGSRAACPIGSPRRLRPRG